MEPEYLNAMIVSVKRPDRFLFSRVVPSFKTNIGYCFFCCGTHSITRSQLILDISLSHKDHRGVTHLTLLRQPCRTHIDVFELETILPIMLYFWHVTELGFSEGFIGIDVFCIALHVSQLFQTRVICLPKWHNCCTVVPLLYGHRVAFVEGVLVLLAPQLRVGAGRKQGCAISQSIINGSLPNFQK